MIKLPWQMFGEKFLNKINKSDKKAKNAFLHDAKNTFSCDAFESDSFWNDDCLMCNNYVVELAYCHSALD